MGVSGKKVLLATNISPNISGSEVIRTIKVSSSNGTSNFKTPAFFCSLFEHKLSEGNSDTTV